MQRIQLVPFNNDYKFCCGKNKSLLKMRLKNKIYSLFLHSICVDIGQRSSNVLTISSRFSRVTVRLFLLLLCAFIYFVYFIRAGTFSKQVIYTVDPLKSFSVALTFVWFSSGCRITSKNKIWQKAVLPLSWWVRRHLRSKKLYFASMYRSGAFDPWTWNRSSEFSFQSWRKRQCLFYWNVRQR